MGLMLNHRTEIPKIVMKAVPVPFHFYLWYLPLKPSIAVSDWDDRSVLIHFARLNITLFTPFPNSLLTLFSCIAHCIISHYSDSLILS